MKEEKQEIWFKIETWKLINPIWWIQVQGEVSTVNSIFWQHTLSQAKLDETRAAWIHH